MNKTKNESKRLRSSQYVTKIAIIRVHRFLSQGELDIKKGEDRSVISVAPKIFVTSRKILKFQIAFDSFYKRSN